MRNQSANSISFKGIIAFLAIMAPLYITACGGGDGGGGNNTPTTGDTVTHVVSTGGRTDNIALNAGQTTSFSFVGRTPGTASNYDTITLNLQDMLSQGYVADASTVGNKFLKMFSKALSTQKALAAYQWELSLRVGDAADVDTVCDDGLLYGPFIITGELEPELSDTESVEAEPSTVSLINVGNWAMCIEISSPVDLTLSISNYSVDVSTCEEDPANFAGTWTGTYACDNTGCEDESGPITLTVTQDGHSAQYSDDGGASYEGTVCGNVFSYNGGESGEFGYDESGTLTLNDDGSASKSSSFVSFDGSCRGSCSDTLTRE